MVGLNKNTFFFAKNTKPRTKKRPAPQGTGRLASSMGRIYFFLVSTTFLESRFMVASYMTGVPIRMDA